MLELNRSRATHKREGTGLQPLRPVQEGTPPPVGSAWDVATGPAGLLPHHWAELQASAIAPDVAAANVASFGEGTGRHWEHERSELVAHDRRRIQTESRTGKGHPQAQAGHLAGALIRLDRRYRHLQAGGWRSLSEGLPGLPAFDQWKPDAPRDRADKPGRSIRYEAPPAFPDGGGLLLPTIPERCWRLICERQGLPFPDPATIAAGFWAWAQRTPRLRLLICEGWKKALCAVSHGYAAVALPGVQMGRRVAGDGSDRLIPALLALTAKGRPWLIAFDADAKPATARKVAAAAGALARTLRAADGRPEIARLPLLPGTEKTGLDDLAATAGPEALAKAIADTAPPPVLPTLRAADRIAAAGQWLGVACPLPSPEATPLVVVQAPMGCGKTEAVAAALAPLAADGVPVLMPSHRKALGQAAAERVGVPWCPAPRSDERLQGAAGCWDSWCPDSGLRISGDSWSGGALVLDEWAQACEHLLLSTGTALAKRRGSVLRTAADQLPRMRQTVALDAQMPDWAVRLLERLTGRRAYVIRSDHKPMAGRPLHALRGFKTPKAAATAFRAQWAQLVADGAPFLCWTSAQKAGSKNAPQTLAALHRQRVPGARVEVIDSTTPEAAARLAADPDGFAAGLDALYVSPSISSGVSFASWRPAAVIALAGGRIAPEHAAQALARVRCPEVPAYLFAPETCPGGALRVGSGATDPADLIRHLRAVADPLLGALEEGDAEGAWVQGWGELGAQRNRQRFAYCATIAGLLEREGWALQAPGPEPCPLAGELAAADLAAIAEAAQAAEDQTLLNAPTLSDQEAAELAGRRRKLEPAERAALDRHRLAAAWGLEGAPPSQALLDADRDGLRDRLRLGFLLTSPEALALIPAHDRAAIAALDAAGRPFAPDRLRVALAPRVRALLALGVPALLERFAAGETIAATDPAVVALHAAATAHRAQLAAAAGVSPGAKATGTLRALLAAVGWRLQRAGRINTRGGDRDALTYRAQGVALPEGVEAQALAAAWLSELQTPAATAPAGALFAPIENPCRDEKCATGTPAPPPPPRPWPFAPVAVATGPPGGSGYAVDSSPSPSLARSVAALTSGRPVTGGHRDYRPADPRTTRGSSWGFRSAGP